MKKVLSIILAALLLFTLMSCGSDPFKGTWVGIDESGNSGVTIEFDGAGKITNFDNTIIKSTGTYKDNGDDTITITLDSWDKPITFVYSANDLNDGVLMLHDVEQVATGYSLELQK